MTDYIILFLFAFVHLVIVLSPQDNKISPQRTLELPYCLEHSLDKPEQAISSFRFSNTFFRRKYFLLYLLI